MAGGEVPLLADFRVAPQVRTGAGRRRQVPLHHQHEQRPLCQGMEKQQHQENGGRLLQLQDLQEDRLQDREGIKRVDGPARGRLQDVLR